jgi:hypothetical protein
VWGGGAGLWRSAAIGGSGAKLSPGSPSPSGPIQRFIHKLIHSLCVRIVMANGVALWDGHCTHQIAICESKSRQMADRTVTGGWRLGDLGVRHDADSRASLCIGGTAPFRLGHAAAPVTLLRRAISLEQSSRECLLLDLVG